MESWGRTFLAIWIALTSTPAWAMDECGFTRFGHVIHGYERIEPIDGLMGQLMDRAEKYADLYKGTKARLEKGPGKSWEPTSELGGGWNDFWAGQFRRWRHFWRPDAETYPRFHRDKGVEELVEGVVAQIRNPDLLKKTVKTPNGDKPWPNRAPELIKKVERWLSLPQDVDRIAAQAFAHEYNLRHIEAAERLNRERGFAGNQGLEVPWALVQADGTLRFTQNFLSVSELPVVRKLEMAGIRETFGTRPPEKLVQTTMDQDKPLPLREGFKNREREQAELQRVLSFMTTQLNHLRQAEPEALKRPIPGAEGTSFEGKTYADLHDVLVKAIDRDYQHLKGKDRRDHLVRHETSRARSELYWKEFWSEFRSIFNIRRAQKEATEFTEARLEEFAANPGATVTRFANSIVDPSVWRNLGKARSWLRGLVVFAGGVTLGATALGTFYTLTVKPGLDAWNTVRKWTDPVKYCAARFRGWEYEDCIKEWVQMAYWMEFQKSRYDPDYKPFEGRPEALAHFEDQMRRFAQQKARYHRLYDTALEIAREEEERIKGLQKQDQEALMNELTRKLAAQAQSSEEAKDAPTDPAQPVTPDSTGTGR